MYVIYFIEYICFIVVLKMFWKFVRINIFNNKNGQDSYLQSKIETIEIKKECKYNTANAKVTFAITPVFKVI